MKVTDKHVFFYSWRTCSVIIIVMTGHSPFLAMSRRV